MNEKKKIHYGWFIVISCVLIMALEYAPLVSCASLFVTPITSDLGFPADSLSGILPASELFMISFPVSGRMTGATFPRKTVSLK